MKIAVASDDQVHIASHFGQTRGFLIYAVENGKVNEKAYIENRFTGHARGQHQGHDHDAGLHHQHSHRRILEALDECEVVISRGMGRRLLDDFSAVGKNIYITPAEMADDAISQYLKGALEHDPDKSCEH